MRCVKVPLCMPPSSLTFFDVERLGSVYVSAKLRGRANVQVASQPSLFVSLLVRVVSLRCLLPLLCMFCVVPISFSASRMHVCMSIGRFAEARGETEAVLSSSPSNGIYVSSASARLLIAPSLPSSILPYLLSSISSCFAQGGGSTGSDRCT